MMFIGTPKRISSSFLLLFSSRNTASRYCQWQGPLSFTFSSWGVQRTNLARKTDNQLYHSSPLPPEQLIAHTILLLLLLLVLLPLPNWRQKRGESLPFVAKKKTDEEGEYKKKKAHKVKEPMVRCCCWRVFLLLLLLVITQRL